MKMLTPALSPTTKEENDILKYMVTPPEVDSLQY